MTVSTASLTQPLNGGGDNAALRAWGSTISGLLSGAGLTKAADVGQVDWVTMSGTPEPGTTGDFLIGYEIWEFDDSVQATAPVVLRVEYRVTAPSRPQYTYYILCTVGTGTDGSGNVVGSNAGSLILSPHTGGNTNCIPFSGTVSCFSSGDGSYLTLALGYAVTTGSVLLNGGLGVLYVDRTRDATGAPTAEGVVVGVCGWGNSTPRTAPTLYAPGSANCWVVQFAAGAAYMLGAVATSQGVSLPGVVPGSQSSGTAVAVDAPVVVCNGKILPPALAALAYYNSDITAGSTITVTVNGAAHTYYCLGGQFALADRLPGQTGVALAVRYE